AEYRAALAEEPDFEPAYEGLGEVLARSGDFEAAVRKEYEALLEKMPQAAKPLEKYFPAVPTP
nr:hypothetical protein [Desulfobacterales bacterium]